MNHKALERFLRIAAGAPSEKRWSQLFPLVSEWPEEAAAAEEWTACAEAALASWPDELRAAGMSERELVEPDTWLWRIAPDVGRAPWLRLVRALYTSAGEVLAAPPGGGWEQSGFGAVRRFHLRDKLSSFGEAARATARALSELDLRANQLTNSAVDGLLRASLPALQRLRLEHNRLTPAGSRRLLAWAATRPGLTCTVKPLRRAAPEPCPPGPAGRP